MIEGKFTCAAIILLGKPTAVFKLRPAVVEVTWTLRDAKEDVVDYKHFTAPFILTVDEILSKIRNLTMRELPGGTLFPDTMKQYDDYSIREALHNAIAHLDYTLQECINFVENPATCIMRMVTVSFLVLCRKHWQFVPLSVILGMSVAVRQWYISI